MMGMDHDGSQPKRSRYKFKWVKDGSGMKLVNVPKKNKRSQNTQISYREKLECILKKLQEDPQSFTTIQENIIDLIECLIEKDKS